MREIILHLSDGRKMNFPDTWDGVRRRWEWAALMDCMKRGSIYCATNSLFVNTSQIVTAERREVGE